MKTNGTCNLHQLMKDFRERPDYDQYMDHLKKQIEIGAMIQCLEHHDLFGIEIDEPLRIHFLTELNAELKKTLWN